ncbi:hypothetical protein JOE63_001211 [Cellulosimicrobium cellulans]|uniref:hypothetical protein n=1 Tax=Cellulosimicrobium cellulans TaxID=1710 RepID=UPI0019569CD7|nr:hypothetical protein [Cellulosimicrobium cellulans]MBM7818734.1 hypothetical protein [Cellulosimicrobium cellulans]
MSRRTSIVRWAAVGAGIATFVGLTGVATAEEQHGGGEVDVSVTIPDAGTSGALAMSVESAGTTLTENGSTALVRQFTGTLPTVTITDTRAAEEIPAGAGWYVLGTASAFEGTAGQPAIGPEHLGWTPRLLDGGEAGLVAEGEPVQTVLDTEADDPFGLVDQELLALAIDSQEIAAEGRWTATADLVLRTAADVDPGEYTGVVTLSLFE